MKKYRASFGNLFDGVQGTPQKMIDGMVSKSGAKVKTYFKRCTWEEDYNCFELVFDAEGPYLDIIKFAKHFYGWDSKMTNYEVEVELGDLREV